MLDSSLIISVILAALIFFFVHFKPLFIEKQKPYFRLDPQNDTFSESLSILEMITELETDYQMGKVSKDDFDGLSLEYKHQYLKKKAEENS
ncbi:MAG: hypothetical protein HQ517_15290 [SAR324 cluster bacterium]|nr:hypothetical protein [SAR324 cluster bacterium]